MLKYTLHNLNYFLNLYGLSHRKDNKRFAKFFWPNNTALFNSQYSYNSEKLDSVMEGLIHVEVPLSTRHVGDLTYGYKKRPLSSNGHAELTYNGERVLQGKYVSKSESRAGLEKDDIQITIENDLKPIEIKYLNKFQYSGGNAGTNYPTTEFKHIDIYQLNNRTAFSISGESEVKTTHTGQDIRLTATHLNRSVTFETDYEVLSGEFDQNSKLSLANNAWVSYHINIVNKTTEDVSNQFIILNLAYPRRNFTFDGSYMITSMEFNTEGRLEWDRETEKPRTLGSAFQWKNMTSESNSVQQEAIFTLKHPSFKKNVTFTSRLSQVDENDLFNLTFIVDYSPKLEKLLVFTANINDESQWPVDRKYTYKFTGEHPITKLKLTVEGFAHKHLNSFIETKHTADYVRSFLAEEHGILYAYANIDDKKVKFHRESNDLVKHFDASFYPQYPEFIMDGSVINSPDLNATGAFYLNLHEKLTWMIVNYTPGNFL